MITHTTLAPPQINRKKAKIFLSGKPDWNYCIQYRKSGEEKSNTARFIGTDDVASHRTISQIIKETCGFAEVEDLWMEPINSWDKPGRYKFHDVDYFEHVQHAQVGLGFPTQNN